MELRAETYISNLITSLQFEWKKWRRNKEYKLYTNQMVGLQLYQIHFNIYNIKMYVYQSRNETEIQHKIKE